MWKTRNQDLIDLISPFVFYAIAKVCAPKEIIDQRRALEIIKTEFGYIDMPQSVIEKVLKRNPTLFKKSGPQYRLFTNLDESVKEIEKRRDDGANKITVIGKQLARFFETHLRSRRKYTTEEAITELQRFFSKHGIFLGTNRLEESVSSLKGRETDYYIALYLFEKRDNHEIEYDYVIDLVKGYFLQSAIYLQASNGNIKSETYKDVDFYYDTPFMLRLLGYKTEEDKQSAIELHKALSKQKGSFFFFPQTQHEIEGILNAYQRSIGHLSTVTLEGLDAKQYSYGDVQRLKQSWESRAASEFKTRIKQAPGYPRNKDGTINEEYYIDEEGLREELKNNIKWRSPDSMEADLESVTGIHKVRGSIQSEQIEHCKAVFVTTNGKLASVANRFYKENNSEKTFPLIITDSDLAALTWVKCGSVGNLPEKQLLRNAYMATQPTPEMLDKFGQVLERMQGEGKITEDIAMAIRSSAYTNKELLFASFEGEDGINENVALKIENILKEKYSAEAREDERYKAERKQRDADHRRRERADSQAREKANEEKKNKLKRERHILSGISLFLFIAAIVGMVYSLMGLQSKSIPLIFALCIFGVFSLRSLYDTWKGTEKLLDHWLVLRANNTYDKEYEKRREENLSILHDEEE